jgi:predicted dehydrogenase
MKFSRVRLAVVGVGNMGNAYCNWLLEGRVPDIELAAICDANPATASRFPSIPHFLTSEELIASGVADAILIATPHYSHTTIGIEALKAGMHVLVEKPISVQKADCEKLVAAHRGRKQVFAAMFNQRTDPYYQKVRTLVRDGELGSIRRINWIITDWFRTESYYASGGWRATWKGEGGGVLLNQCPHNLDLFQWIFGMPAKVRGFCQLGRYHAIEVEDDVTAYFEYADGTTAVFITSTGEAPGTNRLEVTAERGRLVLEGGKISFLRNEVPTSEFSRVSTSGFARPPVWQVEIPMPHDRGEQHVGILKNFAAAILRGEPLIAPAREGIHSVELANAILHSSLEEKTVTLPLSSAAYKKKMESLMLASRPVTKRRTAKAPPADFSNSFR